MYRAIGVRPTEFLGRNSLDIFDVEKDLCFGGLESKLSNGLKYFVGEWDLPDPTPVCKIAASTSTLIFFKLFSLY